MDNNFIQCPKCGEKIQLTQALTSQIEVETRQKLEAEIKSKYLFDKDNLTKKIQAEADEKYSIELKDLQQQVDEKSTRLKEFNDKELQLRKKERELSEKENTLQLDFENKLAKEKVAIVNKVKEQAEKENALQLKDLKNQLSEKENKIIEFNKQQLALNKKERELTEKEQNLEKDFLDKINREKSEIQRKVKEQINKEKSLQFDDMQKQVSELQEKLSTAQKNELDLLKKQRELETAKQEFELEKEKQIATERVKLFNEAKEKSDSENALKLREKEELIKSMNKTIEELKQKSERGSQQLQGEVQELEIEEFLKLKFPIDDIQPVPKGKKGADVIQIVKNNFGQTCGTIIWESKRTKNWSDTWLNKLKEDQREVKADIPVIVSQVLPEGIQHLGQRDGVWIISLDTTYGMAMVLREQLIRLNQLQGSEVGKNQKMETLYKYLCSNEFNQRIQAIVDSFTSMQKDLDSEKRLFEKQWAKREKQIDNVVKNTSGMYGDLQALIGSALPEVKQLEFPENGTERSNSDDEQPDDDPKLLF